MDYVLPATRDEAQRLDAQGVLFGRFTRLVLDRAGIAPAMKCLDVGCGSGAVMRLVCDRVGPDGRIVGLDPNGALGREAVRALDAEYAASCTFVEGALQDVPHVEGGPFDLVTARWTLLHVPDPVEGLRRMWSWLAPGGRLVVIDYDFRTFHAYPELSAISELRDTIRGVLERAKLDPALGSKLPGLFEEAGLGRPDGIETEASVREIGEVRELLRATFESFLPAALQLGVTTEARARKAIEELDRDMETRAYFLLPLVVGCWKRKE